MLRAHMRRTVLGWLFLATAVSAAVIRVATVPPSALPFRADEKTRRGFFEALARAEPGMRATAAENFPGDLWSADDDFHSFEMRLAHELAARAGLDVPEVLRAIDDGIRERWPVDGPRPQATAPPCHPRPIF
jgi:hypothetical protein